MATPSPSEIRAAVAATGAGAPARPRDLVGVLLRRTREEQGGDLDAIATILRIRAAYLVAIEEARYDRLPGPVYALGFVRSYANHLGLDGDEAVRRFKLEAAGLEQRRDLAFPVPLTSRSIPGGRMLLVAFVLAVCAYGIWHYLSTGERNRPERVAAVPSDLLPPPVPAPAAPAPPPADSGAAPPPSNQPTAVPPVIAAPAPAPVTSMPLPPPSATLVAPPLPPLPDTRQTTNLAPSVPPPVAGTPAAPQPAAAAVETPSPAPPPGAATVTVAPAPPDTATAEAAQPPAAAGSRVFGAIDGPSRITLKAVKDCWILVRASDAAQTVVAQRTLHAGDSYRVPARDGLTLRTGNAAGLAVIVDDKPAPALGGTVRNVALDPERLIAGNARME